MGHILIVENNTPDRVARDTANGYLSTADAYGRTLQQIDPGLSYSTVAPYAGEEVVTEGADGVVFTGSGVAWNTSDARAAPLQKAMEKVFADGVPCFGSCNGMQLAASLLGGTVDVSDKGFEGPLALDITLTDAGRTHPMMAGRRDGFAVPCGHRDIVSTPPQGAVVLAQNAHCPVQAMVVETGGIDFWGSQYHPEERISGVARYHLRQDAPDMDLVDMLLNAESDESAAASLGTTVEEMGPEVRMLELRNWLAHINR